MFKNRHSGNSSNVLCKFLHFNISLLPLLGDGEKEMVAILMFRNLSDFGSLLLEQVFKK